MTATPPIRKPGPFFAALAEDPSSFPMGPAFFGFGLIAFLESSVNLLERQPDWHPLSVIYVCVLVSLMVGWWFQALFVGGLHMHLGSKLVGARTPFGVTIKAVGYAAISPCLGALPGALIMVWTAHATEGAGLLFQVSGALWQASFGLWAFLRMVNAVRTINNLGALRTVAVALWLPLLIGSAVVVFIALTQSGGKGPDSPSALEDTWPQIQRDLIDQDADEIASLIGEVARSPGSPI